MKEIYIIRALAMVIAILLVLLGSTIRHIIVERKKNKRIIKQIEENKKQLNSEKNRYHDALLANSNYAYMVNVTENKIHSLYNAGFLAKYGFVENLPYDTAMQQMVDNMKPVILLGLEEFHLTSHYKEAFKQGKKMVEVEYYIPDTKEYKKKDIFLSEDEDGILYAFIVANDVTKLRAEELKNRNALTHLTEVAVKIGQGNLDVEIDDDAPGEVGILAGVLKKTVVELKERIDKINQMAILDGLTGVKNKMAWNREEEKLDKLITSENPQIAIAVCDVNDLKKINDNFGHEAGDDLICRAAGHICNIFKRSPVFRIGGDEFVVVLEDKDYENRNELLERFRADMMAQYDDSTIKHPFSVAIGMSEFQRGNDKCCADIFRRADAIMYENKKKMKSELK